MSSDPLIEAIASDLIEAAFPVNGLPPGQDGQTWKEIIYADAEVAATAARNYFATAIRDHAQSQHRHVDAGGICPTSRHSPDRCDITAALRDVADRVGRSL